ncbi:MAG: metallophosphoesterase [Bacteroidota bacterium]
MKIQYCSDLHLEFSDNRQWLEQHPLIPAGDVLLIGGDTYHLGDKFKELAYWDLLSSQFEMVYLIPGNHEYYAGKDVQLSLEMDYELQIRDNVFLLNNTSRMFGGVEFIFTTLWSKVEAQAKAVLSMMYDFKLIRYNGKMLSIAQYNTLFAKSWAFLQQKIYTETHHKKVVLTHHLPSRLCNIEKYKDSPINEGFCVELTEEIAASQVDYWLYGHSHGNKAPFTIGNTQMLTNQFGYLAYSETDSFDRGAVFEV